MYKSKLYKALPVSFQSAAIAVRALAYKILRENLIFARVYKSLIENTRMSRAEIQESATLKLLATLKFSKSFVPAYADFADYESFSGTTKEDVRDRPESFLAQGNIGLRFKSTTGGTTGKPLTLYANLNAIIHDHAQSMRQLKWAGFSAGDKRAWLRADLIVPLEVQAAPFWRYNVVDRMIMMSSYHLNATTVCAYVAALQKYEPKVIQAYPSVITLLARLMSEGGIEYQGSLKSIVVSSEVMFAADQELIERVFKCKVFNWYGQSERVAAIGTCSKGSLHLMEDYGFYSISPNDGRLIATGFHNHAMPLVKYDTGDRIESMINQDCECGLPFTRIKGIIGRVGDYLISDAGNRVSILNHIPKGVPGLIELQLLQERVGFVDALVVVNAKFDLVSEGLLKANVRAYLGPTTVTTIRLVSSIARTTNGKFRQAICTII